MPSFPITRSASLSANAVWDMGQQKMNVSAQRYKAFFVRAINGPVLFQLTQTDHAPTSKTIHIIGTYWTKIHVFNDLDQDVEYSISFESLVDGNSLLTFVENAGSHCEMGASQNEMYTQNYMGYNDLVLGMFAIPKNASGQQLVVQAFSSSNGQVGEVGEVLCSVGLIAPRVRDDDERPSFTANFYVPKNTMFTVTIHPQSELLENVSISFIGGEKLYALGYATGIGSCTWTPVEESQISDEHVARFNTSPPV